MSQVQLEAFFLVQNVCTAFPSTLVSMLELYPPLPILPLLRVAGLSGLNTIIVLLPSSGSEGKPGAQQAFSILLATCLRMKVVCSSETPVSSTRLHGVTSQKIVLFAMKIV
jgi:hypothetical protein